MSGETRVQDVCSWSCYIHRCMIMQEFCSWNRCRWINLFFFFFLVQKSCHCCFMFYAVITNPVQTLRLASLSSFNAEPVQSRQSTAVLQIPGSDPWKERWVCFVSSFIQSADLVYWNQILPCFKAEENWCLGCCVCTKHRQQLHACHPHYYTHCLYLIYRL